MGGGETLQWEVHSSWWTPRGPSEPDNPASRTDPQTLRHPVIPVIPESFPFSVKENVSVWKGESPRLPLKAMQLFPKSSTPRSPRRRTVEDRQTEKEVMCADGSLRGDREQAARVLSSRLSPPAHRASLTPLPQEPCSASSLFPRSEKELHSGNLFTGENRDLGRYRAR